MCQSWAIKELERRGGHDQSDQGVPSFNPIFLIFDLVGILIYTDTLPDTIYVASKID